MGGEGFPGALIDAMYIGKAIIVSNFGYNAEIIQDEYSGLVYDNTEKDLILKLNTLYDNRKLCRKLGSNARNESKKYDAENVLAILNYKRGNGWIKK